ncbi:hypothetical protein ABPG72_022287 [Tetrahymena utriculariae]
MHQSFKSFEELKYTPSNFLLKIGWINFQKNKQTHPHTYTHKQINKINKQINKYKQSLINQSTNFQSKNMHINKNLQNIQNIKVIKLRNCVYLLTHIYFTILLLTLPTTSITNLIRTIFVYSYMDKINQSYLANSSKKSTQSNIFYQNLRYKIND